VAACVLESVQATLLCHLLNTTARTWGWICPFKKPKLLEVMQMFSPSFIICFLCSHVLTWIWKCVIASPHVLSLRPKTSTIYCEKVKMCWFSSGNWFFPHQIRGACRGGW
jgi:hypothetical protein